ncbi:hypothetical protein ACJEBK_19695 [Peribacillus frigoritolerans]|uniref:hypothetical protein n=1 Tax=Peribacillus frigoritolerans TaxID=450367 RepID=UPI0038720A82
MMITYIIYKNEVCYKIGDLAKMYEVTPHVMKRILKEQNIGTTTIKGFGRALFAIDKNVSVEIKGEDTITKTIEETVEKRKVEKAKKTPAKKKKAQKSKKNSEKKNDAEKPPSDNNEKVESNIEHAEKLQEEHDALMKKGKSLAVKLHKADKYNLVLEICDKHLKTTKFIYATLDDIEHMRLIVAELEIAVADLNK